MTRRLFFRLATLWLAFTCLCPEAGGQGVQAEQPPWADPQAMFEQFFGNAGQVDADLLDKIQVTRPEEEGIGREAVEAYLAMLRRQGTRVVSRGREVAYLQQLVARIHPMMSQGERYPTIRVYYALSDECNARSFPGGYLVFYRGLLEAAENEAALIGMVGHELSHLDRGHHTRRIKELRLTERAFQQPGRQSWKQFTAIGGSLLRVWMRPFRPEYEREADLDGARWSYQAGYDCRQFGKLFLRLHQRGQDLRLPLPEFLQSHPASVDRHQAILQAYQQLQAQQPADDLHVGAENLRRRAAWQP